MSLHHKTPLTLQLSSHETMTVSMRKQRGIDNSSEVITNQSFCSCTCTDASLVFDVFIAHSTPWVFLHILKGEKRLKNVTQLLVVVQ